MRTCRSSHSWQGLLFCGFLGLANLCAGADFPEPYNSADDAKALATPPQAALDAIQLPPGFKATLFAAEPDVQNPIAMTWDSQGRLWIAENYTYAEGKIRFDLGLRDRVIILQDDNHDGEFDSRKVFTDDVQMLTSVEVGHGGVWLLCPPQLLFVPDANGDDVPDGPALVVLDGFTVADANYHNFANGLRWGPDGWLYGRCGHSCPGDLGTPGTAREERVSLRGGMWRYHPASKRVEVVATGTTNPWGHDWNALGECFMVNTVNGHLWHLFPGAHFSQGTSRDPNPRVYQLIDQHADHWHFDVGQHWSKSRDGAANEMGGGHAHSGAMIYQGDNWPERYQGHLFTVNLHGRRLNNEILERSESGFVGRHDQDLLISSDSWFRGIDLSSGPDGGVFILDWSDTGECHDRTGVHRTSGRIFKVTYGDPRPVEPFDMRKLSDEELVRLHESHNEWEVRQARLILDERQAAGQLQPGTVKSLMALFEGDQSVRNQVRALMTLFVIDGVDQKFLIQQLHNPREPIRCWAVRMLTDSWPLDGPLGPVFQSSETLANVKSAAATLLPLFTEMAKKDSSALVRLTLASTLQRLPVSNRAALAQALVSRTEDAGDHNLPLLVWYGLIPVADSEPESILPVAAACTWPLTRKLIARRLAEDIEKRPAPLSKLLTFTATQPDAYALDILNGISEALRGWRKAVPPVSWGAVQLQLEHSKNPAVVERLRELNLLFGDGRALDEMKAIALDPQTPIEARRSALAQLIESRPPNLRKMCEQLLADREMATVAAGGLALFDDPEIAATLIKGYRNFPPEGRPQVISILVSRAGFAKLLLEAVANGEIPRADLTAYHVRQIHSLGNDELSRTVADVWGQLRDTPEDKRAQIAELKTKLTPDVLRLCNVSNGRALYNASCAKCHRLFGEGQTIGPDLTGSNRSNLDYLLENIIDPSAVVNKDFRMTILALRDGRVLNGVILEQTERTITLQSLTEKLTVEKSEIEEMKGTTQSPMPEGQLEKLTSEQIRDLIAYLQSPQQVPLDGQAGE
ncbi:PVC-type heme-binding CxxCH protein [Planctomicrobium sp. SH661]|uniref:PVC-type heme-binding CxxCH protein n=1 Tax=Planctomicrobium sp. SH661 TaxID=3448124 RepID=UPI003F5C60CC